MTATATATFEERQRALADEAQRRQAAIEAELEAERARQRAELAKLADEIRRQRQDDYQLASEAVRKAEKIRSELIAELSAKSAGDAERVEALHRAWLDDIKAFNARELAGLPAKSGRNWHTGHAESTESDIEKYTATERRFAARDSDWIARIHSAEFAYQTAVVEADGRKSQFEIHPIHAEIARLRRLRDEAAEARDAPL